MEPMDTRVNVFPRPTIQPGQTGCLAISVINAPDPSIGIGEIPLTDVQLMVDVDGNPTTFVPIGPLAPHQKEVRVVAFTAPAGSALIEASIVTHGTTDDGSKVRGEISTLIKVG